MRVWSQLWPNLLANALWVPLVAWWTRSRLRREAVEHRAQVEHLLREHRQELHLYLGKQPGKG
ncbi:hypothetical protein [Streptomyces sp. YIM S03343]